MNESIHVLHVEDDEDFAALTAECLEREEAGLVVETARDVAAARQRLAAGAFDCVVSDFDLPEVDGIALLEGVRDDDERLPFILFTGKGSEEVASEALAAGATDYLQKERGTDQFTVLANRIENAVTRHRAVKELERQNDRHETAEKLADLGTWEVDLETGEVWLSEGARRTLGLPADYESDFRSAIRNYHPEDREAVSTAIERAIEAGESFDLEARYTGGDGDRQWVRLHGDPTLRDGEVIRVRAAIQDVTRHKEREAELERYETVVEAAGDPVYTLDPNGRFTFVNDTLVETLGYSAAELLGSHASICIDEADLRAGETVIRSLVEDDERRRGTFEVDVRTADGDRIASEVHVALLPADEDFRGTVGVVRDVSERRRRERDLRRFAAIMDALPVGVFLLDTDGVLVEANDRAAAIAGVDLSSFVGESFSKLVEENLVPDEAAANYEGAVRDLLAGEADTDSVTIETELSPRGTDEMRLVETHITLLSHDSEFEGSVGILRDVTDDRTQRRALERKTDRLTELIDIVSHDLRNPLNVAQSRLELARRDGLESEHMDASTDALERVSATIDDALTLARLGKSVDDPTSVDLAPLARRAWPDDADGSLELESDVTVEGDPGRLETALENLFVNALTHGGAGVTVRLGATAEGGFYVADDGPGIPADERDRIFEPGYSTDRQGTGFGLAIVEHVAAAHEWTVTIADSETGGARFEFEPAGLPA